MLGAVHSKHLITMLLPVKHGARYGCLGGDVT